MPLITVSALVSGVKRLTPFPRRDMAPLRPLAMVEPSVARERV